MNKLCPIPFLGEISGCSMQQHCKGSVLKHIVLFLWDKYLFKAHNKDTRTKSVDDVLLIAILTFSKYFPAGNIFC